MNIYLDTEFTQFQNPRLISIGLCSESGSTFYAQMLDGWSTADCSDFVKNKVLPQFDSGAASMSRASASEKLRGWLRAIRSRSHVPLTIISDYEVDAELMQELLQSARLGIDGLIGGYQIKRYPYAQIDDVMAEFGWDVVLQLPNYSAHHALQDARMLRLRAREAAMRNDALQHEEACCMQP